MDKERWPAGVEVDKVVNRINAAIEELRERHLVEVNGLRQNLVAALEAHLEEFAPTAWRWAVEGNNNYPSLFLFAPGSRVQVFCPQSGVHLLVSKAQQLHNAIRFMLETRINGTTSLY